PGPHSAAIDGTIDEVRISNVARRRRRRPRTSRATSPSGGRSSSTRRYRATTDSKHSYPVAPNLLRRRFEATRPDQIWVGDITFLTAGQSWLYLALLMDVFSRRIVGWALSERIDEALTLRALDRAMQLRQAPRGLIHHTDRGGQYCSNAYRQALEAAGVTVSMSRTGDCWDNAMAESLIKTIKTELGRSFATPRLAHQDLFEYIEGFYNTRRLHSGIDYQTPLEAERLAVLAPHVPGGTSGALSLTATAARSSASPHPQIS
ncbi:MAG: IS3 family transposase, partial [bacterium]|nr:IS3 family transposase [bacterium]